MDHAGQQGIGVVDDIPSRRHDRIELGRIEAVLRRDKKRVQCVTIEELTYRPNIRSMTDRRANIANVRIWLENRIA